MPDLPKYQQLAAEFRDQITTGQLSPGAQLPTEWEVRDRSTWSRETVRRAFALLAAEGHIVARRPQGHFVRERPKPRRHGVGRYARSVWQSGRAILEAEAAGQGHKATQIVRELAEVPAPVAVAKGLAVDPGTTVWVRRRTTLIGDRRNQLADSYYPLDIADAAPLIRQENTGPGGGFARIEDAGITLAEISEDWAVRMPTQSEAEILMLPPGTPVFDLVRTTFDDTGRAVEVMLAVIAGDMATLSYRFPIPD